MLRTLLAILAFIPVFMSCGEKPHDNQPPRKDSAVVRKNPADSLRKDLAAPRKMYAQRDGGFSSYYLRIKDSMYYGSYKGKIECADTLGRNRSLLFDLRCEYIVDAIYLYPMNRNEFFVIWQETDHLGVKTYFAKFERGNSTPKWKTKVEAPSPGQPVVDSPYVYASTLGMIAKMDMNTGKAAWRYDSLFDPLRLVYKAFDKPLVYENTVCFFDFPVRGKKNKRDSIWIDDRTGKYVVKAR